MDSPLTLILLHYITLASRDHCYYSLLYSPAAAAFRVCEITTARRR
ncbi:MAG: hypothetical protein ABSE79_10460 [Terriglobia bacterium]